MSTAASNGNQFVRQQSIAVSHAVAIVMEEIGE